MVILLTEGCFVSVLISEILRSPRLCDHNSSPSSFLEYTFIIWKECFNIWIFRRSILTPLTTLIGFVDQQAWQRQRLSCFIFQDTHAGFISNRWRHIFIFSLNCTVNMFYKYLRRRVTTFIAIVSYFMAYIHLIYVNVFFKVMGPSKRYSFCMLFHLRLWIGDRQLYMRITMYIYKKISS